MKSLIAILLIPVFAACSGGPKLGNEGVIEKESQAIRGQTDPATTSSVTNLLEAYYRMKDALIEYDTASANSAALLLHAAADSVKASGVSDSALALTLKDFAANISSESLAMVAKKDLVEKKRSFSTITENLYPMLQAAQYSGARVYHQMCPMAFNDHETAFWLSNKREIENPYLGKKHPKYASGMLHCGEVKDSLDYAK